MTPSPVFSWGDFMKRIFLFVLDSFGIGAMPDSESFGDVGVNTLAACATSDKLHIPNMIADGKLSGKPAVTEYVNKNGNVVKYESYYGKKSIRKPNKYDSLNTPEIIDMIKTINDNTIIIAHIRDLLTPQENINYSYNDLYQFCARKKRLLFL